MRHRNTFTLTAFREASFDTLMTSARAGAPRGRILACAAAMLLTTSALALAETKASEAETTAERLAVEAAVPMPDTANVPPLKPADVRPVEAKPAEASPAEAKPMEAKPAEAAKTGDAPAADSAKMDAAKPDAGTAEAMKTDTAKPEAEAAKDAAPKTETTASAPTDSKPETATPETAKADPGDKPAAEGDKPAGEMAKPAEAPVAAPAVAAADQPVADQLKSLIESKLSALIERKEDRTGTEAFYAARNYAPLWLEGGAANARAKAAIAYLKTVGEDGLFPEDYPVPDFAAATTPQAQAEAELKFTDTILTYARHAQAGRVAYSRVSGDIAYPDHDPDPSEALMSLAKASDMAAALDAFEPQHAGYQALKAKLAEIRGGADKKDEPEAVRVPEGRLIRPGMDDERVVLLRKRLNLSEDAASTKYDEKVVAALEAFQKENNLHPDGIIGPSTLRKLNGDKVTDNVEETIIANLERWRWLPRKLGEESLGNAYVILNIPDFTLKVMQNAKVVWKTRVVTGKPGRHATPMLSETMKFITVNPTWNVPPSIVYNEYLPALQQDPTVLRRMGLRLTQNRDGSVHISQPPGAGNALGRIRFNFPNKFLVYQHDTPDKHLFKHDVRAYSHGCMRVENPDQYAEALLGIALPNEGYSAAKIRSMYGNSERNINLPTPIPVNITYQTAFVDEDGKLQLRRDIYGRDGALLAQFKDGARKNADIPVARSQPSYGRPSVRLPAGVAFAGSGWQSDGSSFFERLFGGGVSEPPPSRSFFHRGGR